MERVFELLNKLDYDWSNFSKDDLIAHIQATRERPLVVFHTPLSNDYTGVALRTPRSDFIFCNTKRHPTVVVHTLFHELAHVLLNHTGSIRFFSNQADLFGYVNNLSARCRSTHLQQEENPEEEAEAEYFVYLVQNSIAVHNRLHELILKTHDHDFHIPSFVKTIG